MKDDIDIYGQPNRCARCDEVMQMEDDGYGPYCGCRRFVAVLHGGPGDGSKVRAHYPSDGLVPTSMKWRDPDARYVLVDVLDEPGGVEMAVYFEAGQTPGG